MTQAHSDAAARRVNLPLIAAAILSAGLLAAAAGLWMYYGTAVFFEIVRAGIAACF